MCRANDSGMPDAVRTHWGIESRSREPSVSLAWARCSVVSVSRFSSYIVKLHPFASAGKFLIHCPPSELAIVTTTTLPDVVSVFSSSSSKSAILIFQNVLSAFGAVAPYKPPMAAVASFHRSRLIHYYGIICHLTSHRRLLELLLAAALLARFASPMRELTRLR